MSLKFAFAAAASVALLAAPAFADDHITRIADGYVVSFADLDVASAAGQDELARRVDSAVTRYCFATPHRNLSQLNVCERSTRAHVEQTAARNVVAALQGAERRHATGWTLSQN